MVERTSLLASHSSGRSQHVGSSSTSTTNDSSNNGIGTKNPPESQRSQRNSTHAMQPQCVDRSVQTRTEFRITLGGMAYAASYNNDGEIPRQSDMRGWSSPHGEPYRPLGKPELSLKFTPRLPDGASLLHGGHRMRVFEPAAPTKQKETKARDAEATSTIEDAQNASGSGNDKTKALVNELFRLQPTKTFQPDKREVKLARRLQVSLDQRSPEKIRGLRRPHPALSFELSPQSPRGNSFTGDPSLELLHEALHECSQRLRLVRNGSSLLGQVPPREELSTLELQEEYRRAKRKASLTDDELKPVSPRLHASIHHVSMPSASHEQPSHGSGGDDHHNHFHHGRTSLAGNPSPLPSQTGDPIDSMYMPYTSRRLQPSPYQSFPMLAEYRTQMLEERSALRPLRASQSPSSGDQSGWSPRYGSVSRESSTPRRSRVSSTGNANAVLPVPIGSASTSSAAVGASKSQSKRRFTGTSMGATKHSSVIGLAIKEKEDTNEHQEILDELFPMRNSAAQAANDTTPIVKVHSVERLQAAVDSLAAAKTKQSQRLAKSIQHLNEDRRDCLTTKFKHFVVHDSVDHDVQQMREASEQQRQQRIEENIMHQSWYQDLLRALLSRETPLHPAELFIVQAVRRILNDGQEFTPALLYHVLLAMDLDDVALPEVQQILVCLRKALHIPIDDWEAFFVKHGLPEPIEVQQRKEHKAEKRQVRLAKLRNVMTMNQVLRQFPPRILPKPGLSHRGSRKSGLQLQLLQRLGPFD